MTRNRQLRCIVLLLSLSAVSGACRGRIGSGAYPDTRPSPSTIAQHAEYQSELQRVRERRDRRLVWVEAKDIELPPTSDYDEPPDDREYTFYVFAVDPRHPTATVEEMLKLKYLVIDVVGVENVLIAPVSLSDKGSLHVPTEFVARVDDLAKEADDVAEKARLEAVAAWATVSQLKPPPATLTTLGAPSSSGATQPPKPAVVAFDAEALERAIGVAREKDRVFNVKSLDAKRLHALGHPRQEDSDSASGHDRGRLATGQEWAQTGYLDHVAMVKVRSPQITQSLTIGAAIPESYQFAEADRQHDLDALYAGLAAAPAGAERSCETCRRKHRQICCCGARPDSPRTKKDFYVAIEERRAEPNPYVDIKRVRAFNGDLHTQIYMLSEPEAIDAFGEMFSKYFYVGRPYFRNRHPDKTLVVNTTSMRARCLMYREPDWRAAREFLADDGGRDLKRYEYLNGLPSQLIGARNPPAHSKEGVAKPIFEKLLRFARERASGRSCSSAAEQDLAGYFRSATWLTEPIDPMPSDSTNEPERKRRLLVGEARAILAEAQAQFSALRRCDSGCPTDLDSPELASEVRRIEVELRKRWLEETPPLEFSVPLPVTPTQKPFAMSRNLYRQGEMAGAGYLFQDFYRPLTMRAVLVSLLAKTEEDPNNQFIKVLEGIGQVAGALVGADGIAKVFGTRGYMQGAAIGAGVFVPEVRRLLLRDSEKFIRNLGLLGLETVIKISPGESIDGYVFFPKGPIFGYGIDEYGVAAPTFLVNIDNEDVAADGLLVNAAHEFSSGTIDERALLDQARTEGISLRSEREKEFSMMLAKISVYAMDRLSTDVQKALEDHDPRKAQRLIAAYTAINGGKDPTGTLAKLRSDAGMPSVPTKEELAGTEPSDAGGRALLLETSDVTSATPLIDLKYDDKLSTPASIGSEPAVAAVEGKAGAVYTATYKIMLSSPPPGGVPKHIQIRVHPGAKAAELVDVRFAVDSKTQSGKPAELKASAGVSDLLGFVAKAEDAGGSPRLLPWSKTYTVTVFATLKADLVVGANESIAGPFPSGVSIIHQESPAATDGSPRDARYLSVRVPAKAP